MTKIVVNGVDGNFGSQVAKHIQNLFQRTIYYLLHLERKH